MVNLLVPPQIQLFASHLAKPMVVDARLGGSYGLMAVETAMDLGLGVIDPVTGLPVKTLVYAYQLADPSAAAMIGGHTHAASDLVYNPTFLVSSGTPIQLTWMNMLPATGGHLLPLDGSILMSMGGMGSTPIDPNVIPIVTHLHGGHSAAIYDGYPSLALVQAGMDPGMVMSPGMSMASSSTYTYDNSQPSAMIWYHDHSLGYTRLNVYAGLAGQYFIEDQNRRDLVTAGILPETLGAHETNLTIADRSFTSDGQLYYPGASASDPLPGTTSVVGDVLPPDYVALGGTFPTAVPEFFGDFIMVNGTAWPHAHVAQGQEMFDLLNGSDSRFYTFKLDNPWVKVTIVGTDGGLLPKPITVIDGDGIDGPGEQITMAPGDRLQLMFDFSNVPVGGKVHLLNVGAAFEPFKGLTSEGTLSPGYDDLGNPVPVVAATTADSVGQIMEFKVNASTPWHSTMTDDTVLNPGYVTMNPADATVTRKLGVFETTDQYGRIMPMIGTAEARPDFTGTMHLGGLGWDAPVTEFVQLGATEIWEFYNTTADAHPMHIHLGEYQVLARYHISATDTNGDGVTIDGYNNDLGDLIDTRADLPGIQNLYPEDTGNQDTVWVGPGEVLQVIAKFDRPGSYVWHCHILSHEDHDMMRPLTVLGIAGDFAGLITEDSTSAAVGLIELGKADPSTQGFVCGDLTGSANLGVLHLANNLVLNDGTKVDGNNGEWSYTTSAAAQALAEGQSVVDSITISELDGTTHVIEVTVLGVNDAPVINSDGGGATAAASIAENGTSVTTVTATDVDAGSTLTYSIAGGVDAALFQIDATTGALSFKSAPDFEVPTDAGADNVYNVDVQVSDGTLTATQAIAVTVTNQNEAPVISSNGGGATATTSIAENGSAVTTVTATDVDAGTILAYSIAGGADAALFQIDATTGALSFKAAPDFEVPTDAGRNNVYDVIVQASDGSLVDTQAIAVTVTNVNEAPVISSNGGGATAAASIAENGTAVTTVTATDVDAGSTLTYSITGGADAALFQINATTGALSFKTAPDFEVPTDAGADNVYNVVVKASDGALEDSQAIAVSVTNVGGVTVVGTTSNDTITPVSAPIGQPKPGGEEDLINGNAGNDTLDGGGGNDTLTGGTGIDTFRVTAGTDKITDLGNGGADILNVSAGATVNATATAAWTATSSTVNRGTANITTNGLAVNLAAVTATTAGNAGYHVTNTGAAATLTGSSLGDWLTGGAGNDTLVGGGGTDVLNGGNGADIYIIAAAADHVAAEFADSGASGIDEVRFTATTASTLTLFAGDTGIERVVIGTSNAQTTGSTANNIDASALGYGIALVGNAGANVLTGGSGNDTLTGGSGIDTFRVTGGTDAITDLGNGGADVINVSAGATLNATATVAWTASAATVNQGTANITTNGLAVNLAAVTATTAGNAGYHVTNTGAAATLTGSALDDWLTGAAGNDTLVGGGGADQLRGGLGNDVLTGGTGADWFIFNTTPNASTNRDTITDFASGIDKVGFSKAVFTGLSGAAVGVLGVDAFWSGAGVTSAHDATDRFVYNTTTGALYYDADGIGGTAAVQIALLGTTTHPALSYADLYIMA